MSLRTAETVVLKKGWFRSGRGPASREVVIATPAPSPFSGNRYYKAAEVAEILGVSRETVYEWVRSGKLRAQQLPGAIRLYGECINQFLSSGG